MFVTVHVLVQQRHFPSGDCLDSFAHVARLVVLSAALVDLRVHPHDGSAHDGAVKMC